MLERRLQIRYIPRQTISVSVNVKGVALAGHLADISQSGCLLILPLEGSERLPAGAALEATMSLEGCTEGGIALAGKITHLSPVRCSRGAGVRFQEPQSAVVERLVKGGEAGAVLIRQAPSGNVLNVVGHLGFHMNRSFLHPIRNRAVTAIDLGRCDAIDSAGLGLLRIAMDHRVKVFGARGRVKELLDIARIPQGLPAAA